nr:MAG TPA: hypothetical protein [Caudoviricetes sp.]
MYNFIGPCGEVTRFRWNPQNGSASTVNAAAVE